MRDGDGEEDARSAANLALAETGAFVEELGIVGDELLLLLLLLLTIPSDRRCELLIKGLENGAGALRLDELRLRTVTLSSTDITVRLDAGGSGGDAGGVSGSADDEPLDDNDKGLEVDEGEKNAELRGIFSVGVEPKIAGSEGGEESGEDDGGLCSATHSCVSGQVSFNACSKFVICTTIKQSSSTSFSS